MSTLSFILEMPIIHDTYTHTHTHRHTNAHARAADTDLLQSTDPRTNTTTRYVCRILFDEVSRVSAMHTITTHMPYKL